MLYLTLFVNDIREPYARVYLGLGSNIGSRVFHLERALALLQQWPGVQVLRVSRVYESAPVGVEDQPTFLNLAAEIETALAPLELLNATQEIERRVGRVPTYHWGPRVIDIDVILWGNQKIAEPSLRVPHPQFRTRAFVLKPLAEIAADARDPETGRTIGELAVEVAGDARVFEDTP